MERARTVLKWDTRSEPVKIGILLLIVVGGTLGGYGLFMIAMGTTSPLVVVTSESMLPNLEVGDLLILQGRGDGQINVGDIIVFQDSQWHTDGPVVHRVTQIEEIDGVYHYTTKGDNNVHEDPYTRTQDEIVGVQVVRIPWVGHISLFLKTNEGKVFMVFVFILILVIPELVCKDDKEPEQEETPEASS